MTILKLCERSFKWDLAGCPSSIRLGWRQVVNNLEIHYMIFIEYLYSKHIGLEICSWRHFKTDRARTSSKVSFERSLVEFQNGRKFCKVFLNAWVSNTDKQVLLFFIHSHKWVWLCESRSANFLSWFKFKLWCARCEARTFYVGSSEYSKVRSAKRELNVLAVVTRIRRCEVRGANRELIVWMVVMEERCEARSANF